MPLTLRNRGGRRYTAGQATFVTLVSTLVGIGMLAVYGARALEQHAVASWPTVQATVTQAARATANPGRGGGYSLNVVYQYTLGDRRYSGSRYRLRDDFQFSSMQAAQSAAARFPQGAKVNAYYDPDEPATSCLQPGAGDKSWILAAVGGAITVICGLMCPVFWRQYRESRAA